MEGSNSLERFVVNSNTKPYECVLITGATGGFGESLAFQFANHCHKLILQGRNEKQLTNLKLKIEAQFKNQTQSSLSNNGKASIRSEGTIRSEASSRCEILIWVIDLLSVQPMTDLSQWNQNPLLTNSKVDLVINNAGLGFLKEFTVTSASELHQMLQVNIVSLTVLTKFFIDLWKTNNSSGQIINIASVAGFFPVPYYSVYAATKSYVISFSSALDQELKDQGIRVRCFCPGPMHTAFNKVANVKPDIIQKNTQKFANPNSVASEMFQWLINSQSTVKVSGRYFQFITLIMKWMPLSLSSKFAKDTQKEYLNYTNSNN